MCKFRSAKKVGKKENSRGRLDFEPAPFDAALLRRDARASGEAERGGNETENRWQGLFRPTAFPSRRPQCPRLLLRPLLQPHRPEAGAPMIAAAPIPAAEPIAPPLNARCSVVSKPAQPQTPQIKTPIVNNLSIRICFPSFKAPSNANTVSHPAPAAAFLDLMRPARRFSLELRIGPDLL